MAGPLDALAGGLPTAGPSASLGPTSTGTPESSALPEEEMAGETSPEDEDKMMLIEDFRMAPPEDALAAFAALLTAFGVKRS